MPSKKHLHSKRLVFTLICNLVPVIFSAAIAAPQSSASVQAGYRLDNLDWSIADTDGSPNVLSELEWRDVDIFQIKADASGSTHDQIYFRGSIALGWAVDGVNQDSDYAGDNRTLEFSRSINDVHGSRVLDLSAGFGYEFYFGAQHQHSVIPVLGYAINYQFMQMRNGDQVLWNGANAQMYDPGLPANVPLGPFSGLDSSYDTRWWGPWLGLDVLLDFGSSGSAFARFEYHMVDFYAEANWNLRNDLAHPVSFKHTAEGDGGVVEFGWRQEIFKDEWTWGVTATLQSWSTEEGTDRIYGALGGSAATQLNEVNWTSKSLNLTLNRKF